MNKINVALILDNLSLCNWQLNALEESFSILNVKLILNCQNTKTKKHYLKHFFYYVLCLLSLNNRLSRKVAYSKSGPKILNFNSKYSGLWQTIPKDVSKELEDEGISIVIKFGMNLLRIDEHLERFDILSFHHGNPSKYRGRPAGFYELLNGDSKSGVIVQKLSNKLAAGDILAFAETKLIRHSYKQTSLNFYSCSKYLLKKALLNLNNNSPIKIDTNGKIYTLPNNTIVIYLIVKIGLHFIKRILYGIFFEKKWKVAIVNNRISEETNNILKLEEFSVFKLKPKYSFYADPFFSADLKKIRLEALDKKTGLGDILEFTSENPNSNRVLFTGKHYSYPFTFISNEIEYIVPEVASHSDQFIYPLGKKDGARIFLKGLETKRIVDATLIEHENHWYLFFGQNHDAHSVLHLWSANTIDETFTPHPLSPVCMSPTSARMAGRLYQSQNKLYRFGQNNELGYGESTTISRIILLSPNDYIEERCGSISIDEAYGPHGIDLNRKENKILFDYYINRFSLFAGVRRCKAKLKTKCLKKV